MSFKPIDAKRDEYRKYLEKSGAMELLIKVIIKLFECPDKPDNAVEFIRANMGDSMLETDTIEHLKQELEDARNEVVQLKNTLENLKLENKAAPVFAETVISLDAAPLKEPIVVEKAVEETETKLVLSETPAAVEDAEENNEVAELDQEAAEEIEEENKEQPAEPISDEKVAAAAAPVSDEKKPNDDQEKETKDSEPKDE